MVSHASRPELTKHGLRYQAPPAALLRVHRNRSPRELYTSSGFRAWFRDELPKLRPTVFSSFGNPLDEARLILGRLAAGARLFVEPDDSMPGDIKLLVPADKGIWELKTGDVRIFGWFHAHDCFVANSGDDATATKANARYDVHIDEALRLLAACGLSPLKGDHRHVLTL